MTTLCTHCAAPLDEGVLRCTQCGRAVEPQAPPVQIAAPAPLAPDLPAEPSTTLFASAMQSADRDLYGIGGWLIMPAIGLAISPFLSIHGIVTDLGVLVGGRYQAVIANRPGLEALVIFELATNAIFLASLIALNVLLYKKKKTFPACMIAYLVGQLVLLLIDYFAANAFNPHTSPTTAIRSVIACLIWIPYFLQSRRVEITFVH